ncbi:MAG: glycosyltransferase family 4 protein [Methanobacterium sp.]|nr:glycosyltransferase family 4 protein [Methanobacterium sp.]
MKIAYVYDAVYPWVKGGAEKRVYELAKRLAARGHDVHWYGMGYWLTNGEKNIERDGIKFHAVCRPLELYEGDRRSIKQAIYFSWMLLFKLRAGKYDIIDCQGFPFFSCYAAKINTFFGRSALIITLHEVWNNYWYEYLGKAGFFGKLTEKIMVNLTNKIITVSNKTKEDLKELKPSEKSIIIPNGIDLEEIDSIDPYYEKSDIIFVGRLIKEKNTDLLIKSIIQVKKSFPNIKCVIIGEGPEKQNLESLIDEYHLEENIQFLGFLDDYHNIIAHMKSSKVLALPSQREGFGIVVLEANACGLPAVVIDYPMNAAKDLIENGKNGFIAENTEESLAEKIIEAINLKEEMAQFCRDLAQSYNWDKIVDKLEVAYWEFLLK